LNDVIAVFNPKKVAAVGLGTGTINCYSTPEREITFFEINPAVVDIAKNHFTFLEKCGNGMPRIILGDARLELQKLKDEKFDLIILDAFSSDMIPSHLLTKEAVETYLQRLTPDGIILFHITNRFFTLDGPIAATGKELGLINAITHRETKELEPYASTSRWMLLTRPEVNLQLLGDLKWVQAVPKTVKPWTDDYTDLWNIMEF
jgi:spermidine synthase